MLSDHGHVSTKQNMRCDPLHTSWLAIVVDGDRRHPGEAQLEEVLELSLPLPSKERRVDSLVLLHDDRHHQPRLGLGLVLGAAPGAGGPQVDGNAIEGEARERGPQGHEHGHPHAPLLRLVKGKYPGPAQRVGQTHRPAAHPPWGSVVSGEAAPPRTHHRRTAPHLVHVRVGRTVNVFPSAPHVYTVEPLSAT
jgi:hypothetical protein